MKRLFSDPQQEQLQTISARYGGVAGEELLRAAEEYLHQLLSYNRVVALVSRAGDQQSLVTELFLSSLAALEFLPSDHGFTGLDIGSGGGFPAIPLKLARPDSRWTLTETKERKCSFLESIVRDLGLVDMEVACQSFRDFSPTEENKPQVLTSRAGPAVHEVFSWARKIETISRMIFFLPHSQVEQIIEEPEKVDPYLLEQKEINSTQNVDQLCLLVLKTRGIKL